MLLPQNVFRFHKLPASVANCKPHSCTVGRGRRLRARTPLVIGSQMFLVIVLNFVVICDRRFFFLFFGFCLFENFVFETILADDNDAF